MRLPEQRFWDRTRRALSPHFRLERMENLVGLGTPDVWLLALNGRVIPTELKAVQGWPARESTRVLGPKVGLSVDQRNWHMDWNASGGMSAILVGVGGDRQFLVPGFFHDMINDFNRAQFESFESAWPRIINSLYRGDLRA